MMLPKTFGDALTWLRAMLNVPRLLALGAKAERERMDMWVECRALGLDVSSDAPISELMTKRDMVLGHRLRHDHFRGHSKCALPDEDARALGASMLHRSFYACEKCGTVVKNRWGKHGEVMTH